MGMPLFFSASTKQVQAELARRYPKHPLVTDEAVINGAKTCTVVGFDFSLGEDRLVEWTVEVYAITQKISTLPAEVYLQGSGGLACKLDSQYDELGELVSRKLGAAAIVVLLSKYSLLKVRVLTADPTQSAFMEALLNQNRPWID